MSIKVETAYTGHKLWTRKVQGAIQLLDEWFGEESTAQHTEHRTWILGAYVFDRHVYTCVKKKEKPQSHLGA